MPSTRPTPDHSLRNLLLFLSFFIIAFFPSAFQILLKPFLYPLELLGAEFSPRPFALPTCACCPNTVDCPAATTPPPISTMAWTQKTFTLPSRARGSYLITDHVYSSLPEIREYKVGILHLFVQHTSCALSLNENWDEDVRADMSDALDRIAPEDRKGELYKHSCEGPDDMPAHIKSALVGASVQVPITDGKLATGTWQGIWYLEFRASKHTRKVVATIQGEKKS
ncbi:unnamed protein product [Zymoseptoria tritici ST99CH_3D7]|uniref:Secondary thiamine-phosphate synthase enzyme n=2 Tax=Zymoseptoria tritici TaxID=1047171 RepID=A0A1X7S006_ZYMT9|nr:unnamed protein product [Zymoseptoria tritici ST99CH_3D7]SMR56605.1 unnamed protein product [Zymoseptoria tritici ST99CH_1E4]